MAQDRRSGTVGHVGTSAAVIVQPGRARQAASGHGAYNSAVIPPTGLTEMDKYVKYGTVIMSASIYAIVDSQHPHAHVEQTNDTAPVQQARLLIAATTSAASSKVRLEDLLFEPGRF